MVSQMALPCTRSSPSAGSELSASMLAQSASLLLATARRRSSGRMPGLSAGNEMEGRRLLLRMRRCRRGKAASSSTSSHDDSALSLRSSSCSEGQPSKKFAPPFPMLAILLLAMWRSVRWTKYDLMSPICSRFAPVLLSASFFRQGNAFRNRSGLGVFRSGMSLFPLSVSVVRFGSWHVICATASQSQNKLSSSARDVMPVAFSLIHSVSPACEINACGSVTSSRPVVFAMRFTSLSFPTNST
mmetsp:Transcript_48216/g.113808  ORF Transcript_48216/g.113808 Transcript_48216/m.113808 type:complete len:243 (-) Transcript_48216:393-1121(-)